MTKCSVKDCDRSIDSDVIYRCDECKRWFCGEHSDWYGRKFPHRHRLCNDCIEADSRLQEVAHASV